MAESKTAFLTGCASGIGRCLTGRLAHSGYRVFATDLDEERLASVASEDDWPSEKVERASLDVRDADRWEAVFSEAIDRFEGVNLLVNVAGVLDAHWVRDPRPDLVHLHVDVNLKGVLFGTQLGARHMSERGAGHIVNFASMAGRVPVPGLALYSATKFGVRSYSLAAAAELREAGVFVTVVCPDAVQTPMVDRQRTMESAAITFSTPRILTVDDVAKAFMERVLVRRPYECYLPSSGSWTAWLCDSFPNIGLRLANSYARKGNRKRRSMKPPEVDPPESD